ncbi:hypothetical protein FKB36_11990 [Methanoculleus sp. Afa-1]|uniref:Uncharacterized protein n=2 Tax=Methanoculleus formosensis TaxID=2590886 RepID=A0A9E5DEY7_9EURY|nr:hypothetical protein [Methanoculleus sp. Afa-1]
MIRQGDGAQANYRRSETLPVEIEVIAGLPSDPLPDHGNQLVPLPVFDHPTVVDVGFSASFRECNEILGVSISCDADPGHQVGYPEAPKNLEEKPGTGYISPFPGVMRDRQSIPLRITM